MGLWSWCCTGRNRAVTFAWRELTGYPFRNDHFTPDEWDRHLTFRRYFPEPRILLIIIISMSPLWGWSVLCATAVGLWAELAEPRGWPAISTHPNFLAPFTLTSFALSLLMLFKTNSSYGRWWEARQAMGRLLVHSRNLERLSAAYVAPADPSLLPALRRWTAAITPSLAAYLRQRRHYLAFLEGEMHAQELDWLREQPLPPIAVLQVLSELLGRVSLPPMQAQQLQEVLSRVDAEVGCCERILRQPIPPGYSRHTQRFLIVFLTFLPVAFWPLFGWATLPIMAVLSFLLLAIENIGVHLEEPFRVLPLNQMIAGTIRAVHAMADAQEGAAALAAFAAQAGDPPAEGRGARTVLRKSHADFSPRAWHALALARPGGGSAWAGGIAAKAPAWTPPRASPGAVPAPPRSSPGAVPASPPPRPHVPPAEADAVAARDGELPVVREDSSLGQPGVEASSQLPPSPDAVRCAVSGHALPLPPLQQHQPGRWQQGQGPPPLRLHASCSAGLPSAVAGVTSTACPAGRCK
ncbi:hypothetical protein ABPG77_002545 [Micractinium sp. CCAP 211/92]